MEYEIHTEGPVSVLELTGDLDVSSAPTLQAALQQLMDDGQRLVVAGGVGANQALREGLDALGDELAARVFYPRLEFCTDNGAMIAYAGACRLQAGQRQGLEIEVRPRWSLEELEPVRT